jgi:hypothetical protein
MRMRCLGRPLEQAARSSVRSLRADFWLSSRPRPHFEQTISTSSSSDTDPVALLATDSIASATPIRRRAIFSFQLEAAYDR